MAAGFAGFPKEAIAFLRALKRNNRREWFQARKEVYETKVKAPMLEMAAALDEQLARFAPEYVTEPRKAVFRIYRDTRFSHNKSPYKTNCAAVFTRRSLGKGASAGLYFSISPEEIEVAGGLFMPGPEQYRAVREHLVEHHERLRKILGDRRLRAAMGELWDQKSTRPPRGYPKDHPAADLLLYKHWILYKLFAPALATTPRLLKEVLTRFRLMIPFVDFLNEPLLARERKLRLTRMLNA